MLSIAGMAGAQTAFESYMKRVPPLPADTCNISKASLAVFEQQVGALRAELDKDMESRNRELTAYMEKNKGTMQSNTINQMQQQYGISDEDINKMKNANKIPCNILDITPPLILFLLN